jgi:hypothetical protein
MDPKKLQPQEALPRKRRLQRLHCHGRTNVLILLLSPKELPLIQEQGRKGDRPSETTLSHNQLESDSACTRNCMECLVGSTIQSAVTGSNIPVWPHLFYFDFY